MVFIKLVGSGLSGLGSTVKSIVQAADDRGCDNHNPRIAPRLCESRLDLFAHGEMIDFIAINVDGANFQAIAENLGHDEMIHVGFLRDVREAPAMGV